MENMVWGFSKHDQQTATWLSTQYFLTRSITTAFMMSLSYWTTQPAHPHFWQDQESPLLELLQALVGGEKVLKALYYLACIMTILQNSQHARLRGHQQDKEAQEVTRECSWCILFYLKKQSSRQCHQQKTELWICLLYTSPSPRD